MRSPDEMRADAERALSDRPLDIDSILRRAREAKALAEKATPGPWAIESCGEKGDGANIIGVAFGPDDPDATKPLSGWLRPFDDVGNEIEYYRDEEVAVCEHRNRNPSADAAFIAAARTAVPALASDVLSLLRRRDAAFAHGKRAGLISAAEYLEHEATLTEANRDRATDEEHRRAYTVQAGIYRSAALVCRSRAAVAAPEAEDEIAKLRAEIDALKQGVYLWQFF